MDKIKNIQEAYFFKVGKRKVVNEEVKTLSLLFSEEELRKIFYEKTSNVKPETVKKTLLHLYVGKKGLSKDQQEGFGKEFQEILDGWKIKEEFQEIFKLQQEEIRLLYKKCKDLSTKYNIKLPLEEEKIQIIDIELNN